MVAWSYAVVVPAAVSALVAPSGLVASRAGVKRFAASPSALEAVGDGDEAGRGGMRRGQRVVNAAKAVKALPGRIVADKKPRRVAILVEPTPFTHVSGYANRYKEQLKYLREFGDEVCVATPDDKPEAPAEYEGFEVTTVDGFRFPLYAHLCLTGDVKGQAKRMVERFKPDVIHASSPGFFALAAVSYARALDIPLVLSYHTHLPVYAEKYAGWLPFSRFSAWAAIKMAHSFADLTLVTSPQIMAEFKEQKIKRVGVWRKGVDVDTFSPAFRDDATRRVLSPAHGADKTILLYVGRISVEKRLEDVAEVLRRRPDTVFAVVGGGPHESELRKHFAEFGDRVHFVGVLRGDDLSRAYASADLFTMPSDSETLGFVVIEAMASGLPIVAANAGGIPSIVDDNKNGLLIPPGDVKAFADGVDRLLGDDALRGRLTARGRKDTENWSWRAATKHLRNVHYTAAIRRHAAKKRALKNGDLLSKVMGPQIARALRMRFKKLFAAVFAWINLAGAATRPSNNRALGA